MEEKAVFDRSRTITVRSKRIGKTVSVRFPTDEEVLQRDRKVRVIRKRETTDVQGMEAANAELLDTIQEGGDAIEESEASLIIDSVLKAEADEGTRSADTVTVPIRAFGGIATEHELRIPNTTEERKHRRTAYGVIDRPYGAREIKTNGDAIKDFYDLLFKRVSGYAQNTKEAVPLSLKVAAVLEMLRLINAADEEEDPANFQSGSGQSDPEPVSSSTGSSEKASSVQKIRTVRSPSAPATAQAS